MLQDKLNLLAEMTEALREARTMTYQQELEEVLNTFRYENDELKKENERLKTFLKEIAEIFLNLGKRLKEEA